MELAQEHATLRRDHDELKRRLSAMVAECQRLSTETLFPRQGIGMQSVRRLMEAAGQKPSDFATALLYRELVREEYREFSEAWDQLLRFREGYDEEQMTVEEIRIAILDGLADIIVTIQGLCEGMGFDLIGAYNEVMRSNLTKIMPDGTVHKNEMGKIIKPEGYVKPALGAYA